MPTHPELLANVTISYSKGVAKDGRIYASLRPKGDCVNRPINIGGFTEKELHAGIEKYVQKYYDPLHYYLVEGQVIGSNNPENALMEYWKVCCVDDVGKRFIVAPLGKKEGVGIDMKDTIAFELGLKERQDKVIPQAPKCKMRY